MCAACVNCDGGIVAASNAPTRVATSASLANSLVFNFLRAATRSSGGQFSPDKEQNQRANNRHDEARGMKRRAWRRLRKESGDQTADDGTADAQQAGKDEAKVLGTRHNFLGNPTTNETDNDRPDDV